MNIKKILLPVSIVIACAVALYMRPLRSFIPQSTTSDKLQSTIEQIWKDLTNQIAQKYSISADDTPVNLQNNFRKKLITQHDQNTLSQADDAITATIKTTLDDILSKTDLKAYKIPLSLIRNATLAAFLGEYTNNVLQWCGCIPAPKRIRYTLQIAEDTQKRFPDKSQPIIYTALAAEKLFQDLVILKTLAADGYSNITANFIDVGYPDPIFTARIVNATGEKGLKDIAKYGASLQGIPVAPGEEYLDWEKWEKEYKRLYQTLDAVREGEAATYSTILKIFKSELPATKVNLYRNMTEYLAKVKHTPSQEASSIMTLVDPDVGLFQISAYPSESNLIGLSITGIEEKHTPHVFVALPINKPIQIYAQATAYKNPQVKRLIKSIKRIAHNTKANVKFTPQFRTQLMSKFSSYDPSTLKSQLPAYIKVLQDAKKDESIETKTVDDMLDEIVGIIKEYTAAIQKLANQKNESAQALQKNISTIENMLKTGGSRESKCQEGIDALTHMIKITDLLKQEYTFKWFSDAHLAFQELANSAATDKTLIYVYAKPMEKDTIQLKTFNKREYLNRDVFQEFTGQMLLEEGGDIDLDDEENAVVPEDIDLEADTDPGELYIRIRTKSINVRKKRRLAGVPQPK